MGKRSAAGELFLGDMGSIQRELRPSIQREDQLTMETELERIAVRARCEPNLRFTSLAHHITRERVQRNLMRISNRSAAEVDGQTAEAAKKSFGGWIEPILQSVHRRGYRAPAVRRVVRRGASQPVSILRDAALTVLFAAKVPPAIKAIQVMARHAASDPRLSGLISTSIETPSACRLVAFRRRSQVIGQYA